MTAEMVFIMEMAQLLVSIEFAVVVYFLVIRNRKIPVKEKHFQTFAFGVSTYVIERIITLLVYAWSGSTYI